MASTVDFVDRWQKFKDADEDKHKFVEVHIYSSSYFHDKQPRIIGTGPASRIR
jgi:hypothetical protein